MSDVSWRVEPKHVAVSKLIIATVVCVTDIIHTLVMCQLRSGKLNGQLDRGFQTA